MNKNYTFSLALTLILTLSACSSKPQEEKINYVNNSEIKKQGMGYIKTLIGGHLKPALMASMKKDKTGVEGMSVCSTSATTMVESYNKTLPEGSSVRRTALKYRNPNNKPDNVDTLVMMDLKNNKNFAPVVVEMPNHFRIYKALPTKKPCLNCHGDKSTMNTQVQVMINKHYPKDLATDFKENQFRGVVVSEIKK